MHVEAPTQAEGALAQVTQELVVAEVTQAWGAPRQEARPRRASLEFPAVASASYRGSTGL